jgi:hypothetical protein
MLDELRVATCSVVDHSVVVVAHHAGQEHVDVTPQGGVDQAVQEGIVGRRVGAEQELPLRAPAGDQIELAGQHLTRKHVVASSKDSAKHRRHDPRQLVNTAVRQPASVSGYRTPATTLSAQHWSIGNLVQAFPAAR